MCEAGWDFEPAEILRDQPRKARKPHRCTACGERIEAGSKYRVMVSVCDGEVDTHKYCIRCDATIRAICSRGGDYQFNLNCGVAWEEEFGDPPPEVQAIAFMLPGDEIPDFKQAPEATQ